MPGPVHGTHRVFISSYLKDFVWLEHCLRSLHRFQEGFLPPVVCVSEEDWGAAKRIVPGRYPGAEVVIKNGQRGRGMLRAMIAMMECDVLAPGADYYYLVGSDCIAFRRFAPDVYWSEGKPVMLWNGYAEMHGGCGSNQWRTSTEEVLGWDCPNETMRRLPLIYPKELFPRVRAHIEERHHTPFEDYVHRKGQPFSESNVLGCYAERNMPELYTWMHAANNPQYVAYRTPESDSMIQFWSWGGLDRPAETCVNYAPGKNTVNRPPREVINEILGPL